MSEPVRTLLGETGGDVTALATDPRPSTWPQIRLVSALLTAALVAALALPWLGEWLLTLPLGIAVLVTRWLFDSRAVRTEGRVSARVLLAAGPAALAGTGSLALAALIAGIGIDARLAAVSYVATSAVLIAAAALRGAEVRYWRASRRVFLVASEEGHRDIAREIARHRGMALVGYAPLGTGGADLDARLAAARATMLVLSGEAIRDEAVVSVASRFHLAGGRVRDLGGFYERHFAKVPLIDLTPSWFLFDISEVHRRRAYGVAKRWGECALACLLLVLLAPLLAVLAAAVLVSTGRPVLFRQARVGRDGAVFALVKLRTMRTGDDGAPAAWARLHAARVTPVGRLLRRYRLDELPQLLNVVRGEMSLVGPRPEQVPLAAELEQRIPFYSARHRVRPGMTGWAQVHHGYGGTYGGTLEKLQYDFFYIKHQSLRLDGLILLATARAVLRDYAE